MGDTSYSFYNRVDWFTAPRIFYPLQQYANGRTSPVTRQIYGLLRGRQVTEGQVRDALKAIDSALRPGRVLPVRELISDAVRQPRLRTQMLALVSVISLLLAAIGIYAVMAQSVSGGNMRSAFAWRWARGMTTWFA